MNPIFEFETDFAGTLRCIPMCIRYQLDQLGIKLTLKQWNKFNSEERHQLVDLVVDKPDEQRLFTESLADFLRTYDAGDLERLAPVSEMKWGDGTPIPDRIISYSSGLKIAPPTAARWATLLPLQRFTLFKLTRPNHDNDNFIPAMREFGLLD